MKPISPNDDRLGAGRIPDAIIALFNQLIIEKWNGKEAFIPQDVIIRKIMKVEICENRQSIFDKGWMDIEPIFEEAGWKVKYNKQCIGDNFESHYIFTKYK